MSRVVESIIVNVPAQRAYAQWQKLTTLPTFLASVRSVEHRGAGVSHWTVDVAGVVREFDAKLLEQEPDRLLAWTSLDGPRHRGKIAFAPIDDSATEVTAELEIAPEGLMETIADKLGILNTRIRYELQRFKTYMERPTDPRARA